MARQQKQTPKIAPNGLVLNTIDANLIKKYVKQMQEINTEKSASAHNEADAILLNALTELGLSELVEEWRNTSKKSGGFEYV